MIFWVMIIIIDKKKKQKKKHLTLCLSSCNQCWQFYTQNFLNLPLQCQSLLNKINDNIGYNVNAEE